jgi:hypothetical protein
MKYWHWCFLASFFIPSWIQAEHRVRPDLLVAQTGYMQGAAGIGMLLLHLEAFEKGRGAEIILPDSPF